MTIKMGFQATRREFLRGVGKAAIATACLSSGVVTKVKSKKNKGRRGLNVIFILSDDHRYDYMSFLKKVKFLKTPNMDRMAQEGAHLANAFVTTSLCSPSRASILTGKYAHKHGVIDNNTLVPEGTTYFPQYLQKAGYETAFMGKWHMGAHKDTPREGFDKWVSFRGQGVYFDPTFNIDGAEVKRKGHMSDLLTEYALEWLQGRKNDKPFFLYLSHKAVHGLFKPAKRHLGKYQDVKLEYPKSMANTKEYYADKPRWLREQRNSWHGVDYMYHGKMDLDTCIRRYCETLLGVDESIGLVLDFVDKSGLKDNTLVMYMGDNGFSLGEHGLIDKRHMYEESMRVPLLAWGGPIINKGTRIEEMVQNIDIGPTVMETAGLKTPDDMDGRSFLPLLKGEKIVWRDAVFYEYYWERNFPQTPTVHGIRTGRYKYIHYHGVWDIDELYDLEKDSDEMHNLIKDQTHAQLVKELNKRMFDWLEETGGMLIPLRRDARGKADLRRPGTSISYQW